MLQAWVRWQGLAAYVAVCTGADTFVFSFNRIHCNYCHSANDRVFVLGWGIGWCCRPGLDGRGLQRMLQYAQGRIQDFLGGVPRNFVNDNMWREAPLEMPKASQGKVRRGAQWPLSVGGVWGASPKKI